MAFNSITRLRLRSFFTLPAFLGEARASAAQAGRSAGFISGALLLEGRMVFWTRTAWESADAMKAYRDGEVHRAAMPKLADWCDEASVAHWEGEPVSDWDAVHARMVAEGRLSRVRHPTAAHTAKQFSPLKRWAPEQPIARSA
ncbi:MAG: hypothetical protein KF779_17140 [Hyphomonadaceae bacterium]|nr:hypothetical protein [Hyphomonadaceae bacterium]